VARDGLIIGTYLHGIFENENFRNAFMDYLYSRRNMAKNTTASQIREDRPDTTFRGDVYDELSKAVETNLQMDKIWNMLGLDCSSCVDKDHDRCLQPL
jgi:adenosylcobyric acid synthase